MYWDTYGQEDVNVISADVIDQIWLPILLTVGFGLPDVPKFQQNKTAIFVNGLLPEGKKAFLKKYYTTKWKSFGFTLFLKKCLIFENFRLRRPQPDNREQREGGNDEACIAILNNFYSVRII